MKITERRLRSIIRSIIKENIDSPGSQEAQEELDTMNIHKLEDYLTSDMPMSENSFQNEHKANLRKSFREKMDIFKNSYQKLSKEEQAKVNVLAEQSRIKKGVIAVSNAKLISKIMFSTLWAFPLIIAVFSVFGIVSVPAFIAGAAWVKPVVTGSFIGGLFGYGFGNLDDHRKAISSAEDDLY
jgi:hypothetical protein